MTRDEAVDAALRSARTARKYRNALSELLATLDALGTFTEGQLCEASGLDRVTVRELIDAANIDEGSRDDEKDEDLYAATVRWGKNDEALTRVLLDGRERTCAEIAAALGLNKVATLARLRRSKVAHQPRKGMWALVSNGKTSDDT